MTNVYFVTLLGTCFSTRGAPIRHQVKVAGDASSFTVTTMHDIGNTFDPLFASPDIYGVQGLTFAVIDDYVMPQASVSSRGASVFIGNHRSNNKSSKNYDIAL